jgi:hypothetical protein
MTRQNNHRSVMCNCNREKIYTGRKSNLNPKVNGVQVCIQCYIDHITGKNIKRDGE